MSTMNFTDEERRLLATLPHTIGSAVAFADSSGLIGTGKEMFASANAMLDGLKKFPNNELIKSVVPQVLEGEDRQVQMQRVMDMRDWSVKRLKSKEINSYDKFRAQVLSDAREVNAMLIAKAPAAQAEEYRSWLMSVAETVANAATEGGFMGFGSTRLSSNEAAFISDLKAAINVA